MTFPYLQRTFWKNFGLTGIVKKYDTGDGDWESNLISKKARQIHLIPDPQAVQDSHKFNI
jgi:hypothetical protein